MFQCGTSSASGPGDERLIVVGQVMSGLPSAVRDKLTKKLSELAEAKQNKMLKKQGMKGLDTITGTGAKPKQKDATGTDPPCVCVCVCL